jgi:uncharacterized protein (DUF58 family)
MVSQAAQQPPLPPELLRKIRRIEIRARRLVDHLFLGQYHSVFRGRGLEFSEVREYQPGDDERIIDWNVTARMGSLYVKKYVEERELTVYLLVDASASQTFGTAAQTKAEVSAEIGALLALAAVRNNDRVGLIVFTDRIERFVPPRQGSRHVLRIIRDLLYLRPEGRGTDVAGAIDFLNRVARRRSVAFLISDLHSSDFEAPLRVAARRHDVIAITMSDRRELALPAAGLLELVDAETGESAWVDSDEPAVRESYAAAAQRRQDDRRRLLAAMGVDEVPIFTDQPYVGPLVAFFRSRLGGGRTPARRATA